VDWRAYSLLVKLTLREPQLGGSEPVHDLDQIPGFMSGPCPAAQFDLPWMPLYLGICYLFRPLIGLTATVGTLILVAVTFVTQVKVRRPSIELSSLSSCRNNRAEAGHRNGLVMSYPADRDVQLGLCLFQFPGERRAFNLKLINTTAQVSTAPPDVAFRELVRGCSDPGLQHEALIVKADDLSLQFLEPLLAIATRLSEALNSQVRFPSPPFRCYGNLAKLQHLRLSRYSSIPLTQDRLGRNQICSQVDGKI